MSPRDKWEIGPDGSCTWNRDRRTPVEIRAEIFKREIERLSGMA